MEKWIEANNAIYMAEQKLDTHDCGFVKVYPIDKVEIFREFGHGFVFSSESHVATLFRRHRQIARQNIKQTREMMVVQDGRRDTSNLELKQRIAANKRLIAALLKFEPAQRKAVREEARRLNRVQKAAGLLVARNKRLVAVESLCRLTEAIAGMKPINREGALAVIDYVGQRLFPDRVDFFMNGSGVDGNFCELLQIAHNILEQDQLLDSRCKAA